jgi:methionine synthase I (cobalamin-dependent)
MKSWTLVLIESFKLYPMNVENHINDQQDALDIETIIDEDEDQAAIVDQVDNQEDAFEIETIIDDHEDQVAIKTIDKVSEAPRREVSVINTSSSRMMMMLRLMNWTKLMMRILRRTNLLTMTNLMRHASWVQRCLTHFEEVISQRTLHRR